MSALGQKLLKSLGAYFDAFDERAGGTPTRPLDEETHGGASCTFCLAALVSAMGYVISAATASAASPF